MTIVEDEFAGANKMELTANRDKVLGRKVIRVDIVITTDKGDITSHVAYYDREYLVVTRAEMQFGDGVIVMAYNDVEFDLKLDDSLFEAPKDVTFTE